MVEEPPNLNAVRVSPRNCFAENSITATILNAKTMNLRVSLFIKMARAMKSITKKDDPRGPLRSIERGDSVGLICYERPQEPT